MLAPMVRQWFAGRYQHSRRISHLHQDARIILRVERLENRELPVVGALSLAQTILPGQGYDGVVRLDHSSGGLGSASLLSSGRHFLTAAHVITDDSGSLLTEDLTITFHLPTGTIEMVVRYNSLVQGMVIPKEYNGATTEGADIAVLTLPDQDFLNVPYRQMIAPLGAQRFEIYTGKAEIGEIFTMVGYGRTGTGASGAQSFTAGTKRIGYNRFDADANLLSKSPYDAPAPTKGLALVWDFDDGTVAGDSLGKLFGIEDLGLGAKEANPAQGDSGGPLFLGSYIAGIISYSDGNIFLQEASANRFQSITDALTVFNDSVYRLPPAREVTRGFGEFGVATRVSAYQDFITSAINTTNTLNGKYHLVLDMDYQPWGNDGRPDSILLQRVNGSLQVSINGVEDSTLYPLNQLLSFTVRGSRDGETIILRDDLGVPLFIHGEGGADTLRDETGLNHRWILNGVNQGLITFRSPLQFRSISTLVSVHAMDDIFTFHPGGRITGKIVGSGQDWLAYSSLSVPVRVNLLTGVASFTAGISGIRHVLGSGVGQSLLVGDHFGNILVGFGHRNNILGNGGNDLLIGGNGVWNILRGGTGDDLIFAGGTFFDRDIPYLTNLFSTWNGAETQDARIAALESLYREMTCANNEKNNSLPARTVLLHQRALLSTRILGGAGQNFFLVGFARLVRDRKFDDYIL